MSYRSTDHKPYTFYAVDVFAGGGGLTYGLKRAGFTLTAAVEIEPHAYATLLANHPEIKALKQDVRTISGRHLTELAYPTSIDLLAACPPCQGFTSLTSKYKRPDPRNELVSEVARLVEEIRPRVVMIENVPGLATRGKSLLDAFLERIDRMGYKPTIDILQVADYGVPQYRRRLVVLAGHGFEIDMPKPTHSRNGQGGLPPWKTVKHAIGNMPEPITLSEARKLGTLERMNWHLVRSMSNENKLRIKHAKPGEVWTSIPEELRPDCHRGSYEGFRNVYGRMQWDDVSPTITGGCTTFSKGRFGHPEKDRTISVREAALLQTFPRNYKIDTPYIEYACDIVGNALPCDFAEAVARECYRALANETDQNGNAGRNY